MNGMQKIRFFIFGASVFSICNFSNLARANDDQVAGQLPEDFYTAPEDADLGVSTVDEAPNAADFASHAGGFHPIQRLRGFDPAMRSFERIVESTGHSLDLAKDLIGSKELHFNHEKPSNWVPWHLRQLHMNLGVSLQGTIGVITAIGQTAADIFWVRRPQSKEALGLVPDHEQHDESAGAEDHLNKVDLRFDDGTSSEELEQLIDPIAKTVMATKRVDNESEMRQGLKEIAQDMQILMSGSAYAFDAPWLVQQYRVDVTVQVTGKVHPGMSAGGAVRLRLEWNRRPGRPFDQTAPKGDGARNLAELFRTLGHDFEAARSHSDSPFKLQAIQVGIGMYLNAKFAVVKGNFGVMGLVLFQRQQNASQMSFDESAGPDHLPVMEMNPPARHLVFADKKAIAYEKVAHFDRVIERALYHVSRERFREGLEKSAAWADQLAARSDRHASRKWFVNELRPMFTLSIQGATPFVTVGGSASISFRLRRDHPPSI